MTENGSIFSLKMKIRLLNVLGLIVIMVIASVSLPLIGFAIASEAPKSQSAARKDPSSIEEVWGIRIQGIRLSAEGYMLDFRYRIIDPDKASTLVNRKFKPYLIHQASGAKLMVPAPSKVGPLRQTTKYGKPKVDRIYFVLFANPGRFVKRGNKVTVVIGDFRAENLTVE